MNPPIESQFAEKLEKCTDQELFLETKDVFVNYYLEIGSNDWKLEILEKESAKRKGKIFVKAQSDAMMLALSMSRIWNVNNSKTIVIKRLDFLNIAQIENMLEKSYGKNSKISPNNHLINKDNIPERFIFKKTLINKDGISKRYEFLIHSGNSFANNSLILIKLNNDLKIQYINKQADRLILTDYFQPEQSLQIKCESHFQLIGIVEQVLF